MKQKPYGVVVWRALNSLMAHQRAVFVARAYGFSLEVAVVTGGRTLAQVDYRDPDTGGFTVVERYAWQTATDSVQVEARQWCERTAFTLAEKAAQ